jgi:hypothetical protein
MGEIYSFLSNNALKLAATISDLMAVKEELMA